MGNNLPLCDSSYSFSHLMVAQLLGEVLPCVQYKRETDEFVMLSYLGPEGQ